MLRHQLAHRDGGDREKAWLVERKSPTTGKGGGAKWLYGDGESEEGMQWPSYGKEEHHG
jgi:hypothetical protein